MEKKGVNLKWRQLYAERAPDQRREDLLRRGLIYAQRKGSRAHVPAPPSNPPVAREQSHNSAGPPRSSVIGPGHLTLPPGSGSQRTCVPRAPFSLGPPG